MSALEETFTDKEFCKAFRIDRATSLRWREQGIVGYWKMPNGNVRYGASDIETLRANFKKMEILGLTLKDISGSLKGRVIDIRVAESGNHGSVSQNA